MTNYFPGHFRVLYNDSGEPVARDDNKIDLTTDEVDGMILRDPRPFRAGQPDPNVYEARGYRIVRVIEEPDRLSEAPLDNEMRSYFDTHIGISMEELRDRGHAREDRLREQFDRDNDIMRGLGEMPSLDDLRYQNEELAWASIEDSEPHYPDECQACGERGCHGRCLSVRND